MMLRRCERDPLSKKALGDRQHHHRAKKTHTSVGHLDAAHSSIQKSGGRLPARKIEPSSIESDQKHFEQYEFIPIACRNWELVSAYFPESKAHCMQMSMLKEFSILLRHLPNFHEEDGAAPWRKLVDHLQCDERERLWADRDCRYAVSFSPVTGRH